MKPFQLSFYGLIGLMLLACNSAPPAPNALRQALAADSRTADSISRDSARHPEQTLAFFKVEPQHTVVEIWPGGKGWYTEILAPYLRAQGQLYAAHFHPEAAAPFLRKSRGAFDDKLAAQPELYDRVSTTVLQPGLQIAMAPPASADRVLTFRNVHNWMKAGYAQDVFDASYAVLKPGGLLGVVEHRAAPETSLEAMISSGYVTEAQVLAYSLAAGFELVARSEINANPRDIKQYPAGVWSLPPTLRLGEQDKAYYQAIGESDRMTLLFKKPE